MKSISDIIAPLNLTCTVKTQQFVNLNVFYIELSIPGTNLASTVSVKKGYEPEAAFMGHTSLSVESIKANITLQTETLKVLEALLAADL